MTPVAELAALGAFYEIPVDAVIAEHGPALDRYTEWVLGRDDFALVTLGSIEQLAPLAHPTAAARLRSAAARWPQALTGIKLELDGGEPTLYVRPVCPWSDGLEWLRGDVGTVVTRIPPARTLYGLGFQGELVKTYALSPDGFVSFRITGAELQREHKEYRADVAWDSIDWPDARWTAVGALGRTLGFRTAGHVGRTSHSASLKVYVERTGAIITDRSFA
ncbi:MAG TPA: hypothetical protein VF403_09720 [Kofleriaceae bacterium]